MMGLGMQGLLATGSQDSENDWGFVRHMLAYVYRYACLPTATCSTGATRGNQPGSSCNVTMNEVMV